MIYYLISPNYINVVTFASIIFAFAITCLAIYMGKNILPRDGGRAYAINGSKSVGKPRGAGIIFILVFTITCMIFVNLSSEIIIYLILVLAAMLSGYLDDASSSPWGELKKGIIDFVIAVMAAVTYLHYNPNTFDISLFKLTVTLNPIIYGVLIVILIWVSINVTNCSDGVDGLCGTLSAITLSSAYVLFMIFDIESSFRHTILIMVVCILGYLWFNAAPSKLLMGDAWPTARASPTRRAGRRCRTARRRRAAIRAWRRPSSVRATSRWRPRPSRATPSRRTPATNRSSSSARPPTRPRRVPRAATGS